MLLPEKISPGLAPYLVRSHDEIVEVMGALCHQGITVTCFIEGGFIPAEARIVAALPASREVVMVALSEVE